MAGPQATATDDAYETPFETQLVIPAVSGVLRNDVIVDQESFEEPEGETFAIESAFDLSPAAFLDRFAVPDNSDLARDDFQDGFDGEFAILGQDFDLAGDDTRTVSILGMNVIGGTDLSATLSIGANGIFEGLDGISIYAAVDGAFPATLIGDFAPSVGTGQLSLDTNGDNIGDGAPLTTTLTDYTFPIDGTGTVLDITIDLRSDNLLETLAIDNLRTSATGSGTAGNVESPTAKGGTVTLNEDGSFTYDPPPGFIGNDTFTYEYSSRGSTDTATVTILVGAGTTLFDFGDAPTAAQSGFASSYAVTLAQDGARHQVGTLRLGSLIDGEPDGLPDEQAGGSLSGGDDNSGVADEDGVFAFAPIIALDGEATTSGFQVAASASGKLDAWIDFNRDGDWDDAEEQIAIGADLVAGANVVSFNVPSGSAIGQTGARFRLSSSGGLAPAGNAEDGEVEDYMVTIVDGDLSSDITVSLAESESQLTVDSGDYVILMAGVEVFRVPTPAIDTLSIVGTDSADLLGINTGGEFGLPVGGLQLRGAEGENTLRLIGEGGTFDLTDASLSARDFAQLDLSLVDANRIVLDAASVIDLSPASKTITITTGESDVIEVKNASSWRMGTPKSVEGEFVLTANNSASGGTETIEAKVPHAWQNFLQLGDVNNDGSVSAGDALRIINELGRRAFSDAQSNQLDDPDSFAEWPGVYFDHNGDDRVTALDALRVINDLARQSSQPQFEEVVLLPSVDVLFQSESELDAGAQDRPSRTRKVVSLPPSPSLNVMVAESRSTETRSTGTRSIDSPKQDTKAPKDPQTLQVLQSLQARLDLRDLHISLRRLPGPDFI